MLSVINVILLSCKGESLSFRSYFKKLKLDEGIQIKTRVKSKLNVKWKHLSAGESGVSEQIFAQRFV